MVRNDFSFADPVHSEFSFFDPEHADIARHMLLAAKACDKASVRKLEREAQTLHDNQRKLMSRGLSAYRLLDDQTELGWVEEEVHQRLKQCHERRVTLHTVGATIEPSVAFGLGGDHAKGKYSSDGGQAPFSGSAVDKAQQALNAGIDLFVPLVRIVGESGKPEYNVTPEKGPSHDFFKQLLSAHDPQIGLGLRGGILFQNKKITVDIVRHGADGRVRLTERELANLGLYVMFGETISIRIRRRDQRGAVASPAQVASLDQVAALPGLPTRLSLFFYGGVGPTFTNTRITLTSNKAPGGGVYTSTSKSNWDVGLGVLAGVRAALCRACAFGNPLRLGFEWQGRWMPERNVATTSPTFGFTETGRVHDRFSQQFMVTLSIPFTVGLH